MLKMNKESETQTTSSSAVTELAGRYGILKRCAVTVKWLCIASRDKKTNTTAGVSMAIVPAIILLVVS